MQQLAFDAMGCQMLAILDSDAPAAARRLAQVPAWFAAWEACLSRFRPDSELVRLNRHAGSPVAVSDVLWEVLQATLEAARQSDGLVTPTLLPALEAAGYDRSFELLAEEPAVAARRASPPADWWMIDLDPRTRTVRLPAGMRLDLGGIAKGWAADRAVERLAADAPALVDAGGDIALSGPRTDVAPWPIGIADPAMPEQDVELLLIDAGGVATSGRDYRRWRQGEVWRHHLLDPRTLQPAATDVVSATVIAPTAREAEMGAKAAVILGSVAGLAWLEAQTALAGMLILDDGGTVYSRRLHSYLWEEPWRHHA